MWWSRKDRIEWELEQLTAHGYEFEPPADVERLVTLAVYVNVHGERHRLLVDFPRLYPYFRFEVRAPIMTLAHHQHPFGKNLCLMPRGTYYWEMGRSLADYLDEQLPKVVGAGNARDIGPATTGEEPQAEPFTDYYPYQTDAMILIDGSWRLPDCFITGRIVVRCDHRTDKTEPIRGTLMKITTMHEQVLFTAPAHLDRGGDVLQGVIAKIPTPAVEANPANLRDRLSAEYFTGEIKDRLNLLAVVMPEEHAYRDSTGQGWVFITSDKQKQASYVRAGRAGARDLLARAPELHQMSNKTIPVFGLGCIGGISAIEFAKAGSGEVRLLDHDHLDPGTLLRWYLGLPMAGLRKARTTASFIRSHYPLTRVGVYEHYLGRFENDDEVVSKIINGASIVYDAAAEPGVSYFLAELARHQNIPFVHVSGTQGGWGGMVVRLNEHTGCWCCFQQARKDRRIPPAPADTNGNVQPAGCGDPTFTGAGFDLATIALTGVRAAIASLHTKYPAQSWDVMIISLRDEQGNLIPPQFAPFMLPKDPSCKACGSG